MKQFTVKKRIDVMAEPHLVWDALTNPEKTKQYFFNCRVLSDWKVGNPITFRGKVLLIKKIEMTGKILAIIPDKLLKYNLANGKGGAASVSTVTDELEYNNGITTLSVTDDVGGGEGAEKRYRRSEKAWDKVLEGLKDLVEKEARPAKG
jgi:uncharacterized protein YndB with AHSA1/START domain